MSHQLPPPTDGEEGPGLPEDRRSVMSRHLVQFPTFEEKVVVTHRYVPPPPTEAEKLLQKLKEEQELSCLQRNYNLLQKDRQFRLKAIGLSKVLTIYTKEHQNILTDLKVADSPIRSRETKKEFISLTNLLDRNDMFVRNVKLERQRIKEVEAAVRNKEKDVVKLRAKQVTDKDREYRVYIANKTIEQLMNKLDVQTKQFGTICTKNSELKMKIESMLKEREVFLKIWHRLIDKLSLGKSFLKDLIEQASVAYDEREQCCSKLQALSTKARRDLVLHNQEMRELEMKENNIDKLEEFFTIKGLKRVMRTLEKREVIRRFEYRSKMQSRLAEYKQYLEDILEFTKEGEVSVIARKFYQRESRNFSNFKRVLSIIEQMEGMNHNLSNLRDGIVEKRYVHSLVVHERQNTLHSLKTEVETLTKGIEEAKSELAGVDDYINTMLSGIVSIFRICKCDRDPLFQLLDDVKDINIFNYSFFLEMIESAVLTAMVELFYNEETLYDKRKITSEQRLVDSSLELDCPTSHKFLTNNTPCPLCIERDMVGDVVDSLQIVMSRTEAAVNLAERLQSRPELAENIHNLSKCLLPKSREALQKRFM